MRTVFRAVLAVALTCCTTVVVRAQAVAVYDPTGKVSAELKAEGIAAANLQSLQPLQLASDVKLLIIGPNSLNEADATSEQWRQLLDRGVNLLVLEQIYPHRPLHGSKVLPPHVYLWESNKPLVLDAGAAASPLFAGVDADQFAKWSAPTKFLPLYGAFRERNKATFDPNGVKVYSQRIVPEDVQSLAESTEVSLNAAVLVFKGEKGTAVLSQLPIGTTLGEDALARKLFSNMVGVLTGAAPTK